MRAAGLVTAITILAWPALAQAQDQAMDAAAPVGPPAQWYERDPAAPYAEPASPAERTARRDLLRGRATSARYAQPLEFILDLTRAPGYEADREDVSGWLASLAPTVGFGALQGSCLATLCVVTVDLPDGSRLAMRLDFSGPSPKASFTVAPDNWSAADIDGTIELTAATGDDLDLGFSGKLDALGLNQALSLAGFVPDSYAEEGAPPGPSERVAFARWQQAHDMHPTGLVSATDWGLLQQEADKAAQAAGWTTLADEKAGWSLSYPANVLDKTEKVRGGRRLAGMEGAFTLEVTVKPALADDAFDAMWEQLKAETKTRTVGGYSRSNQDLWLQAEEKGMRETVVIHGRPGGLLRVTIRYPLDRIEEFTLYEELIRSSIKVSDDLKP